LMNLTGVLVETKVEGQKSDSRRQVQLKLVGDSLVIASHESNEEILVLDVNSIEVQRGGNRRGLLFFESSLLRGSTLYVDFNASTTRFLSENSILQGKIASLNSGLLRENLPAFLSIGAFIGFLAVLIIFRGPIFGGIGALTPFSWEQGIAEKVFTQKLSEKQHGLSLELNELAKVLYFDSKVWKYPFHLHISSKPELNAYATLGGHIFVNRGLIQEFSRTEQLLGVIAHEMIHVQQRHVVRSIFQGLGLFVLIQTFLGDFSGLIAIAVDQGGPLLNLQYSRELELEADALGLELLVNNQVDPRGLPEGLQVMAKHMQELRNQQPGQETAGEVLKHLEKLEIFSTHPELEKRIANLFSSADKVGTGQRFRELNFDYVRFKTQVKENF
jgi:Zn-dependent protease with chaperone function